MKKWIRFLKDEEGFTAKEYGLITMIAMGIITAVVVFLQTIPYLL